MSDRTSSAISPRIWLAVLGVLGTAAVGCVSFLVGVVALGGILISYGGWKTGVDQHLSTQDARIVAVESTTKEQITALATNTDKQILAVTTACKEMVTNATEGLRKSIEDIERDRKEHITAADAWRANESATVTELKTIVTNQQRQIDLLTEANAQRTTRH